MATQRWRSAMVVGIAGLVGVGAVVVAGAPASAGVGDGALTIEVYRDSSGTGVYDAAVSVPQAGIQVDVTDEAGNTASGLTDGNGRVQITSASVLTGGKYRIQASIPPPLDAFLSPAPANTLGATNAFSSMTSFVDVSGGAAKTVRMAVWNPSDYTQLDPPIAVPIQRSAVLGSDTRSLVSFPWTARGLLRSTPTVTANQVATGATYGVAYDKVGKRLFQSAFAKRFTAYGPAGSGAIYVSTVGNPASTVVFATVPNTGTTAHVSDQLDTAFYDAPGKESLGGIAMSEDNSTLYAINLFDRTLHRFDMTGNPVGTPVALTAPTGAEACASPTDWRPSTVVEKDAKLYIGGVCSAESTGARSDLRLVIQTLDLTATPTFTTVFAQSLAYEKGDTWPAYANGGGTNDPTRDIASHWNAWTSTFDTNTFSTGANGVITRPEPLLSSIVFDKDGSLIIGLRDRWADQNAGSVTWNAFSGGDLNKACHIPSGSWAWSWEGTNGCPNNNTSAAVSGNESASVQEFFPGDWMRFNLANPVGHAETAMGGVAYSPRMPDVVSTTYDPINQYDQGGVGFYSTTTGQGPGGSAATRGAVINANVAFNSPVSGFGKGNGLGVVTLLAELAPIQIGNRVWYDADHDGIQDPDEPPIPGVIVTLRGADGHDIESVSTDANGEYYFGSNDGTDNGSAAFNLDLDLTPNTNYIVHFDQIFADVSGLTAQFGITAGGDLTLTDQQVSGGTQPLIDSNPNADGDAPVTTGGVGSVDHSIDAGFVALKYLRVSKSTEGGAPDPAWLYAIDLNCVDFRGRPITITDPTLLAGASTTVALPTGASCTVTETDAHGARSTTYATDGGAPVNSAPTVAVEGSLEEPTDVALLNTFVLPPETTTTTTTTTTTVSESTTTTGPPASTTTTTQVSTPPLPPTTSVIAPVTTSDQLPVTGSNTSALTLLGGIVLAGGIVLMTAVRRRKLH